MVFTNQSLQKELRFLRNDKVNFNFISRLLRRNASRNDKTSNARILLLWRGGENSKEFLTGWFMRLKIASSLHF